MADNSAWKKRWLDYAGLKDLSEQEIEELKKQSTDYTRTRIGLEREISEHTKEIASLKGRIESSRPSVKGATLVHSGYGGCGLKAAVPFGRTPEGGLAGGDDLGYCLFCRSEYMR